MLRRHINRMPLLRLEPLIGYDRYEGLEAYNALTALYAVLRLYINFFQPSLKLVSKTRVGAKVTKKYDIAKTPYQRLLMNDSVDLKSKQALTAQYATLDPVWLLKELERLQDVFWKHAWKQNDPLIPIMISDISEDAKITQEIPTIMKTIEDYTGSNDAPMTPEVPALPVTERRYRTTKKSRKKMGPRAWRTRPDPFADFWGKISLMLILNPERTAKSLLMTLSQETPALKPNLLRTLQRRVKIWRKEQIELFQKNELNKIPIKRNAIEQFTVLTNHAILGKISVEATH